MSQDFEKYSAKLLRDGTAVPDSIRFYRLDDEVTASRNDEWLPFFTRVFSGLNVAALLFAKTLLPFADLLIARSSGEINRLVPKDSETRVFLHDIPFIRSSEWRGLPREALADRIAALLRERKAAIIQDLGVVAAGGVTVEQSFIGFSTIVHTTTVKYLLDLLTEGFRLPEERTVFEHFKQRHGNTGVAADLPFAPGPLQGREAILEELCRVGRYTVEQGYVDSFFGNISYFDGSTIYISQTASSLDELEGHIDPVPLDASSTAGLSASSELPAHRAIYLSTNARAVLHGHPKFSVIMSMLCEERHCAIEDCHRRCDRPRSACGIPIVAGETGAGGLAKTVPAAVQAAGVCLVYGHGVFAAGAKDLAGAFRLMADAEMRCRKEYFTRMEAVVAGA